MMRLRAAVTKLLALASASAVWSLTVGVIAPVSTETAVANGDTRTIHFYHTHTGESIDATFRVDGHYDQAVLDKLNYFLRDWRNNDQTRMDPRLFDTVWEVYRTAGADQPIQIYSAYRSPETNAMLRRRSRAVAEHSQHMLGKAMDTTMPGMSMERIREIGMRLQHGGVGYYQSANFVHLDVGGVRSWPRMNYDQLARLFPDGKTVHIPANGQPMARYEEARAEIAARGGTEIPPAQQSQGFFAWLFGGPGATATQEDEDVRTAVATRAPVRGRPVALAYANSPEPAENNAVAAIRPTQAAIPAPEPQPVPEARPQLAAASVEPDNRPQPSPGSGRDAIEASTDFGDVIPVPPRRPAEMVAMAEDLPLPPVRPDAPFRLQVASIADTPVPMPVARPAAVPDAIGGLITSTTSSGVPMLRRAALPAIITQGTEKRLPSPALSFAATETPASLRTAEHDNVSPHAVAPARSFGLRTVSATHSDHKSTKAAVNLADVSAVPADALTGPSIYGLRRAAQGMAGRAL